MDQHLLNIFHSIDYFSDLVSRVKRSDGSTFKLYGLSSAYCEDILIFETEVEAEEACAVFSLSHVPKDKRIKEVKYTSADFFTLETFKKVINKYRESGTIERDVAVYLIEDEKFIYI